MSDDKLDGYTRVTNFLYPFSGLESIPAAVVEKAANRGTRVHKICESIASGLGEFDVDEELVGYVNSFKHWWKTGIDVQEMEIRFFDHDLKITGQADFVIRDETGSTIVDLKTSYRPSPTWPVQGSAYAMLARKHGFDIQKIQFIHLNKKGNPPKIYEYPVDDDLFLSVRRTYNHFYLKRSD